MPTTPLTPQDVADAVNALEIDKATFTQFLAGAALLAERNQIQAKIAQAQAAQQAAVAAAAGTIQALNSQLAALDAQYNQQFGGTA